MKYVVSFSGGKDSVLALDYMTRENYELIGLFTTTNKDEGSWFHDINLELLDSIAQSIGTNLFAMPLSQDNYSDEFEKALIELKNVHQIDAMIFGDIDLEGHLEWCQQRCKNAGIKAIFPLWQRNRLEIVNEFISLGYKAIIKKVDKVKLSKKYLGQVLDNEMISEFSAIGIDECGENGEYHTVVVDGPLFNKKIETKIEKIEENEYTYNCKIYLD